MLLLRHSVVVAALSAFSLLAFLAVFYGFMFFNDDVRRDWQAHWLVWPFVLAPLALIPRLAQLLRTSLRGRSYVFDGNANIVTRNRRLLTHFAGVRFVQLRTICGVDFGDEYRLSLSLHDGSCLHLARTGDCKELARIASAIAALLNVPVRQEVVTENADLVNTLRGE
ncbi:MAG: hypothetical protein ACXW2P_01280 [Thermoanaerobaculia bacterium]